MKPNETPQRRVMEVIFAVEKTTHWRRFVRAFLIVLAIAAPTLVTYGFVTFQLNRSLCDFVPQWSDEIFNWHQVATFREAGFYGGYYTVNEKPAAAAFTHFYTHGPMYPMIVGGVSSLLGWHWDSPLWGNLGFLAFAVAVYVRYSKVGIMQLGLLFLTLILFWPLHLYTVSCMREGFFAACAILCAAWFWHLFAANEAVTQKYLWMLLAIIFLLTLLKMTNAILFVPLCLAARQRFGGLAWLSLLVSAVLMAISAALSIFISAPYPNYMSTFASLLSQSVGEAMNSLLLHTAGNLRHFFDFSQHPLWLVLRAQLLLCIAGACWMLWRERQDKVAIQLGGFILLTSLGTLTAAVVLYDVFDWRDYRLIAPIVLTNALLLIANRRVFVVSLMAIINLAMLPVYLETHQKLMLTAFTTPEETAAIQSFSEALIPVVKYDKKKNGWGNTLLLPLSMLEDRRVLGVPPGIGISWYLSADQLRHVKSRYLLLDKANYEILKNRIPLEYAVSTSLGNVYIRTKNAPAASGQPH